MNTGFHMAEHKEGDRITGHIVTDVGFTCAMDEHFNPVLSMTFASGMDKTPPLVMDAAAARAFAERIMLCIAEAERLANWLNR